MDTAALMAALNAYANKPALLLTPTKASILPSPFVATFPAGLHATAVVKQTQARPQVTPAPMTYDIRSPKTPSDTSSQLCRLALALDMLRAVQAPATRVPISTWPALPQQRPLSLVSPLVATNQRMPITGPLLLQGLDTSKQRHADAPLQALHRPSPDSEDCMSGCSRSQEPELDSGVSTPAEPEGADVGGTFLSRERILQIYSLRSRYTCSARSPIEKTAAGRSAVVARIYNMPVEHVLDIWRRARASHITEPVLAEFEQQRYQKKVMLSNMRRSLKRKHQNDQEIEPSKRRHVGVDEAHVEDLAGTPPQWR